MDAIEAVARVAAKIAPGRFPSFGEAHVVEALEKINSEGSVGRLKLSRDLQLGEGETRTLVRHLDKEGLVEINRSGISLSAAGRKLLSSLRTMFSEPMEISSSSLTIGRFNIAVLLKGMSSSVKYGLEQRDDAVAAGAKGATTLVFTRNIGLVLAGTEEPISKNEPIVFAALSKLSLEENDVIVIGSADEKLKAELGAKAAAIELLKGCRKPH